MPIIRSKDRNTPAPCVYENEVINNASDLVGFAHYWSIVNAARHQEIQTDSGLHGKLDAVYSNRFVNSFAKPADPNVGLHRVSWDVSTAAGIEAMRKGLFGAAAARAVEADTVTNLKERVQYTAPSDAAHPQWKIDDTTTLKMTDQALLEYNIAKQKCMKG